MALESLLVRLVAVVVALVTSTALVVVGLSRLGRLRTEYRSRGRAVAPYLVVLLGVMVLNRVARRVGSDVSWTIGLNITGIIYGIEGTFVAAIQSLSWPPATAYFTFVYVYGYVYLLVFPLVAYFALEDPQPLRETLLAYAFNYLIGLGCYVLFVAYGPRNLLPELVDPLLYATWPQSQLLTTRVNTNTNVFPSLHASLSVTVALLAYRTRDVYSRWLPVAVVLAASVGVSTMYLGIHWATDVVAGTVLAVASVSLAGRWDPVADRWNRVRTIAGRG